LFENFFLEERFLMALELIIREPAGTPHKTPLLFVHGIHHGAWCYDDFFLPYFAQQGFVAGAVSLRGHGNSPINGSLRWTRVHRYVEDVEQAAQQMVDKYGARPVIIGHSMGGLTTQKFLEKHAAPGGVLLASVPPHGILPAFLKAFMRYPVHVLLGNLTLNLSRIVLHSAESVRWAFFSDAMPETEVQKHYARMCEESFLIFFDMLLFALPRPSRVKTPILVIAGETDTLFKTWEEERLARAYHGDYKMIAGMAHDVMLEKDWQQAADHIIAWVREKGMV
jgi:alpha-beta hydrolase superfamily lysophospholipase